MQDTRYFRWRTAIKKPIWVFDRHWYAMLGGLYLLDRTNQRQPPRDDQE